MVGFLEFTSKKEEGLACGVEGTCYMERYFYIFYIILA